MLEETALVIDDIESCKAVVAVEELVGGEWNQELSQVSAGHYHLTLISSLSLRERGDEEEVFSPEFFQAYRQMYVLLSSLYGQSSCSQYIGKVLTDLRRAFHTENSTWQILETDGGVLTSLGLYH